MIIPRISSGAGSWASRTAPVTAAVTGNRASRMANRAAVTRRRTSCSIAYGITELSTAMPTTASSRAGSVTTGATAPKASGE